jgi:hypothetical protein
MPRTTGSLVASITEVDPTIDLVPFIEIAEAVVTRLLADLGVYSAVDLELIERWLAAHFYHVRDPLTEAEGAAGLSEKYEGRTAEFLEATSYGQQAMVLDTSGRLAGWNNQMKKIRTVAPGQGQFRWLGTVPARLRGRGGFGWGPTLGP